MSDPLRRILINGSLMQSREDIYSRRMSRFGAISTIIVQSRNKTSALEECLEGAIPTYMEEFRMESRLAYWQSR